MNKKFIFCLSVTFLLCCSISPLQQNSTSSRPQQDFFNTSAKTVDELCKDNCCRASLGAVKEYSYLVIGGPRGPTICPKDAEKNQLKCVTSCPKGTVDVRKRCITSLVTCRPQFYNLQPQSLDDLCKESDSCCKASLSIVRKYSYLVTYGPKGSIAYCPRDAEKIQLKCVASCPKGTIRDQMSCETSLRTCIPRKPSAQ